nr:hypothetical protein [uncultured Mediterranean phage uvMED]
MANLKTKVDLYLKDNSKTWEAEKENIILQNDSNGNGDYIHTWNVSGVSKPTTDQLNSFETAGNDAETLNNILSKREREYPSLKEFAEAYCEKEIGGDSTKWNAYITAYNKVRTDNPKE